MPFLGFELLGIIQGWFKTSKVKRAAYIGQSVLNLHLQRMAWQAIGQVRVC